MKKIKIISKEILYLPRDCIISITLFLKFKDILTLKLVCKQFNEIINNPSFYYIRIQTVSSIFTIEKLCYIIEKRNKVITPSYYLNKTFNFKIFGNYIDITSNQKKITFQLGFEYNPLKAQRNIKNFSFDLKYIFLYYYNYFIKKNNAFVRLYDKICKDTTEFIKKNIKDKINTIQKIIRAHNIVNRNIFNGDYFNNIINNSNFFIKDNSIYNLNILKNTLKFNNYDTIPILYVYNKNDKNNSTKVYKINKNIKKEEIKDCDIESLKNLCRHNSTLKFNFYLNVQLCPLFMENNEIVICLLAKDILLCDGINFPTDRRKLKREMTNSFFSSTKLPMDFINYLLNDKDLFCDYE
jgi:hypothetical protein